MGICSHRQSERQSPQTPRGPTNPTPLGGPTHPTMAAIRWDRAIRRVMSILKLRILYANLGRSLKNMKGDTSSKAVSIRTTWAHSKAVSIRTTWAHLGHYLNDYRELFPHLIRKHGVLQRRLSIYANLGRSLKKHPKSIFSGIVKTIKNHWFY